MNYIQFIQNTTAGSPAKLSDFGLTINRSSVTSQFAGSTSSGSTLIFASDFGYATGSGQTAMRDGPEGSYKWNNSDWYNNNAGWGEIIPSTGLNFPSTNVMRITVDSTDGLARVTVDNLPTIGIGESLYFRWYFRAAFPNTISDPRTHPIEGTWANGSARNWAYQCEQDVDDALPARFYFPGSIGVGGYETAAGLSKNATYRHELQINRTGTTTFVAHARVYDTDDSTLLYDDDDFIEEFSSPDSLADNPEQTFQLADSIGWWHVGIEGLADPRPETPTVMYYQGCFAASIIDWCGPYTPGEAD